jgi:hypothetical protein
VTQGNVPTFAARDLSPVASAKGQAIADEPPAKSSDRAPRAALITRRDGLKVAEAIKPQPSEVPVVKFADANPQIASNAANFSATDRSTSNLAASGVSSGSSTDSWFQVRVEAPEPASVEEAVVTTPADGNSSGPQPLAQVLADLARRAHRNFVDPGIPSTETVAYNFTEPDLDPWEAFSRLAQIRGYRIVFRDDIGWNVGLKSDGEGEIEVWFARLLLGWIEPELGIFLRADISR